MENKNLSLKNQLENVVRWKSKQDIVKMNGFLINFTYELQPGSPAM